MTFLFLLFFLDSRSPLSRGQALTIGSLPAQGQALVNLAGPAGPKTCLPGLKLPPAGGATVCLLANMGGIIPDFSQIASTFFDIFQISFGCYVTAKPARAYEKLFFKKISPSLLATEDTEKREVFRH